MKFELKQLSEDIFSLTFDNSYDLAMHFLRWSEFTESIDPEIKSRPFVVLDFIESYAKEHDNIFTYPEDWVGFNIPSSIFDVFMESGVPDHNKYDAFMFRVVLCIKQSIENRPFYLIGCVTGSESTIDHEIAHAMYDRASQYKEEVDKLIKVIKPEHKEALNKTIQEMGYSQDVVDDELQAYCATGLTEELQKCFRVKRIPKKMMKNFAKVFKKHKDILMSNK